MEDKEKQNAQQKAQELIQTAKQTSQLAANLASGNFIGAAKNAINLLKDKQFKKKLKRKIITTIIQFMIPVMIVLCMFGIVNTMKDELINLLSSAVTSVTGFLSKAWQWITDDYWIKLDEKIEYIVDADTGETLGLANSMKPEDYLDENGNPRNTITENYTIVDKYVKELGNQGVSLKNLRLLGDADYSNEEKLLEDGTNKELVEKYIAEFIRADIITQQPHRQQRGTELVCSNNHNWIDGGVYFYRSKGETDIDFKNVSSEPEIQLEDSDYKQMDF